MNTHLPKKRSYAAPALLLLVGVVALVLLTQHAVAGAVARFVGGLWVSVMEVVLRLVASVFGA